MQLPAPYRDAAPIYRAAGWSGVLPIPYGTKKLLAKGWTGHNGQWPSGADIQAWLDDPALDAGGGNIALRLPPDVIGIDVDAYAGKNGAASFTARLQQWGPLPPTWISTARDDGVSGIRLFRVPDGLRWPGQAGEHIEIIQVGHRYLVVSPSLNPDSGTRYRWIRPDGIVSTAPPGPDDLPELPIPWILGLTGGEAAEDATHADLAPSDVQAWIVAHHRNGMCRATIAVLAKLLGELHTGSAHEALRRTFGLCRLAEQGHTGLADALVQVRAAFHAEATRTGRRGTVRSDDDAEQEWRRSLAGAVRRVVGSPSIGPDEEPVDPCVDPFAALVDPAWLATATPAPAALAGPPAVAAQTVTGDVTEQSGAGIPEGAFAAEGDTWRRRDLAAARRGEPLAPTLLTRSDKRCLFYPGKINALIGESESGKSWLALLAIAQEINAGNHVVYVDFEDTDRTLVARLAMLGCDPDIVDERVAYISPEETLTPAAAEILAAEMAVGAPTLVVLDGVNAAMARLGLDSNSTTDATRFAQILLARLVAGGAGVITIDHVSKNKETRGKGGIGSQAKRAMISGAAIAAEVVTPFGRGMTGKIRLLVDKDRHGGVREHAAFGKTAGTAIIRSLINPDRVTLEIDPSDDRPISERGPFRPTGLMEKASRFLASQGEAMSTRAIEDAVKGKREHIAAALSALAQGRYVDVSDGPRGARLYRHVTVYREMDDLVEDGE